MKWWKKGAFLITLVITGIFYYKIDEDLLKTTRWENMDQVGGEKPDGDWELLQEGTDSVTQPGEGLPVEDMSQGEEPGQAETQGSESQDGDNSPGAENPDAVETQESGPQDPSATEEADGKQMPSEPEPEPEPEIRMGRVESDYFSDALFLGDSRTVGLGQYGSLGDVATFYASTGMTIYKIFKSEIVEMPGQQEKITVDEALQHQSFNKIYIMMGINEMGSGTPESFAQTYGEVIARLQELQPEAIIYIQGILKVTKARSDKGDYINNEGIEARNAALSLLADGQKIFYLDVNQAVCDEDGALVKDYTFDGVHLKAKYISLWEEFLKDNAVLLD